MYYRTARALERSGRGWLAPAAAVALLAAWMAWFFLARVSVYEVSRSARLEVDMAPHAIGAPVAGRVIRTDLRLGHEVREGDLLLELDAERFRVAMVAEEANLRALAPRIAAVGRELTEQERALRGEGAVVAASTQEERAHLQAVEAEARQRATEQGQLETLRRAQAASALEAQRTTAEAERTRAESQAHVAAIGRLGTEKGLRLADRRAGIARLEQQLAALEGERAHTEGQVKLYREEIALRSVRAPVAGRLEEVEDLRPGAVVEAGVRVAVVVPSGTLRAVAYYDPATAVGRVRPGQRGRLRLHAFPWTNYGSLAAVVDRVGSEPREDGVRVELLLRPDPGSRIPLQHGLPGSAEIEVERLSPAALALDAAGRYLTRASQR